jgi:hypothetical protein
MALPYFQRTTVDPDESVLIVIQTQKMEFIPKKIIEKFRNLDGEMSLQDMKIETPITLPIWQIIEFKKKRMGRLVIPNWLSLTELQKYFLEETRSPELSKLPYFWFEISKLLLEMLSHDALCYPSLPPPPLVQHIY